MYPLTAPTTAATPTPARARRRVIDDPMRMFHWLFASAFAGAYLSADSEHFRLLHVTLGYILAGLFAFRLAYGLFGPQQARLARLGGRLAGWRNWLHGLRHSGTINWRQGQNLLMALAIAALLLLTPFLVLSGYAVWQEWGLGLAGVDEDWLEELHELAANAFLAVVLGHLALILGLSLLRGTNQALPMLTGQVEGAGPSLVKKPRRWLAALLLIATLAYAAWAWLEAPHGLVPALSALSSPVTFL
ncbi:cytochrome b/b6 domain-containing protein [Zoogloea dura]|jgi:cytochrome b|uniref:Cytochrome b/b6 domain-containing protein n=1 Tax=Zoogloea dura TaxID=2728840 RepID=A0A848G7E9_9RHOO|nr:cytochrome b/b6 domain-containing protein [Zoogloea dura]NML27309.1 cytochrome b/b6 domain-containing protein [Zoogloea dura]